MIAMMCSGNVVVGERRQRMMASEFRAVNCGLSFLSRTGADQDEGDEMVGEAHP
jgi:hypothetical protein